MGTNVTISVYDLNISRSAIKKAVDEAFNEAKRIDMLMSNYRESSDISKINKLKAGEDIKVSEETMEVLRRSQEISALSKGAFDITVLPLMELWGFYSNSSIDNGPTHDELAKVLKRIGRKKITLRPKNYVTKNVDGVKIDLGGIAKGYAVDRAIGRLKSCGIKSALVEAGGDLYCLGIKPDKNLWRIAIQHPRKKKKVIAVLEVTDCAVATSGDYENYNIIRGKRYSHIIDPRTGYPKVDVPASVTIVAKDTTTADGLATAIFVLGHEEGMNLVESLPDVEAVIISDKGGVIKSAVSLGLKDKIKFIGDSKWN
ncbi:MAG: FAD:protein FMN transferase [Candidatus Omnitrophota bacterium]